MVTIDNVSNFFSVVSNHENNKIRNMAFVGGIDLAFQRWDDEKHRVSDEEGVIYPGRHAFRAEFAIDYYGSDLQARITVNQLLRCSSPLEK